MLQDRGRLNARFMGFRWTRTLGKRTRSHVCYAVAKNVSSVRALRLAIMPQISRNNEPGGGNWRLPSMHAVAWLFPAVFSQVCSESWEQTPEWRV